MDNPCHSMERPLQLSASVIGAGNVATHIAKALAENGITVRSIYSRTLFSASTLADKINDISNRIPRTEDLTALKTSATNVLEEVCPADFYVVSVKDDAIADIAEQWPESLKGGVVFHTAGSVPMDVLTPAASHYGVLYPMQTFSKEDTLNFKEITCFIEGNDSTASDMAMRISTTIFGRTEVMSSADRKNLHLAAVFACNFSNHMYSLAYDILEHHDVDPTCLLPLIHKTVEKLSNMHPVKGQTGPARRFDNKLITRHLEALGDFPEQQNIYRILTKSIQQFATKENKEQ